MGLIDPLITALDEEGYHTPTPIQAQAIPPILEGRDILGCAQTGTGKTAAFSLPLLQRLNHLKTAPGKRPIRALILTPTRELAIQIKESIDAYGRHLTLKNTVIFGGVGQQPQVNALRNGIDILVATPGRLLDLCQQGHVSLKSLEVFILDEADRMLDMGFIHDVRKIIAMLPEKRQSLFFSATMPKEIQALADKILTQPFKVEVAPPATTAETIQQCIYRCDKSEKKGILIKIITENNIDRALVFSRTKHGADRIAKDLNKAGIRAESSDETPSPIVVFVAKDHNYDVEAFSNIKEGQRFVAKVIGQRFELNDTYISIIAEIYQKIENMEQQPKPVVLEKEEIVVLKQKEENEEIELEKEELEISDSDED